MKELNNKSVENVINENESLKKEQRSKTCVGRNCGAINGVNHSAECMQDLDEIFDNFK